MATTINIPLALSTVGMSNANAFWKAIDGTNFDYGVYCFLDAVTGIMTFEGIVPSNVAATPAWNLILWSKAVSGAGGNIVLTVNGKDYPTATAYDGALTSLISTTAYAINTSANTTKTTLSGTNLDGTEAVAAGNKLIIEVQRIGGNGSDTLNADWYLLCPPIFQIDVT